MFLIHFQLIQHNNVLQALFDVRETCVSLYKPSFCWSRKSQINLKNKALYFSNDLNIQKGISLRLFQNKIVLFIILIKEFENIFISNTLFI